MASSYRRGGLKKELLVGGAGGSHSSGKPLVELGPEDYAALEEELQGVLEVLSAPKSGKDLSAAIWRPALGAAELVLARRGTAQQFGFMLNRRHYLHIEEAAYLVDRSDLMLFIEVPVEQTGDGADQQQPQAMQRRLLSLQETFELMEMCGVNMERYIVYSSLSRIGYLLMRYPSRWVLDEGQTPADVWGHGGAWAHCHGMAMAPKQPHPASQPQQSAGGVAPMPSTGPQQSVSAAGTGGASPRQAAAAQHRGLSLLQIGDVTRSLHQGLPAPSGELPAPLPASAVTTTVQKQAQQPAATASQQLQTSGHHQTPKPDAAGQSSDQPGGQDLPQLPQPQQEHQLRHAGGKRQRQEASGPDADGMHKQSGVVGTQGQQTMSQHCRTQADCPGLQASVDGCHAQTMDVDNSSEAQDGRAVANGKALSHQPGPTPNANRMEGRTEHPPLLGADVHGSWHQRRAAAGHLHSSVTAVGQSRTWYPAAAGTAVLLEDDSTNGWAIHVEEAPGPRVRAAFPRLRPLQPIVPRMGHDNQQQQQQQQQQVQRQGQGHAPGEQHTQQHQQQEQQPQLQQGPQGHGQASGAQLMSQPLLPATMQSFANTTGPALPCQTRPRAQQEALLAAAASEAGHLVFDVYQPGCKVARSKRVFPTLHCHIAMSSERPPGLSELMVAGSQAVAPHVPVRWAAVEGGIVTMYELQPADLLSFL